MRCGGSCGGSDAFARRVPRRRRRTQPHAPQQQAGPRRRVADAPRSVHQLLSADFRVGRPLSGAARTGAGRFRRSADGDAACFDGQARHRRLRHGRSAPVRRTEDRHRQQARPAGRGGRTVAAAADRSRGARADRCLFLAGRVAPRQPFDPRCRGAAAGRDTPSGRTLGEGRAGDQQRPATRGAAG